MALPVVAIIGRPNVGKSTLVNRLCRSREAIVHDEPGVTRDRTYQEGFWADRHFRVVDTGGLVFDDDSEFLPEIREQANLALAEASVAVVIVDGQQGCTAADESIAEWLRGQSVPVLLAVNKCESPEQGLAMAAEFWGLGLGEPQPISAIHGAGTGDLLDQVIGFLPPTSEESGEEPIQLAIVGRPNVGKSSLLNQLAGYDAAIVTDIAGTTRDTLREAIQIEGVPLHVIDTAGLRDTDNPVERLGIERTWAALDKADLAVLLTDAQHGVGEQEAAIISRLPDIPLLTVHNKIDLTRESSREGSDGREIWLSARTGEGMDRLRRCLLDLAGWQQTGEGLFTARARHLDALRRAGGHLDGARRCGQQLELFAEELRLAQEALGEITGAFSADDLLGVIFSQFCIGK